MNILYVSPPTRIKKYREMKISYLNQLRKQFNSHAFVNTAKDGTSSNLFTACGQMSKINNNKLSTAVAQNEDFMLFYEADKRKLIHEKISSESILFLNKLISRRIR
jgi:hypothetical protein